MSILKGLTVGFLGGLAYAIISFCLITPYMRYNIFSIGTFAVRGFIFSSVFLFIMSLLRRRDRQSLYSPSPIFYAIIGCISGLLCPLLDLMITYHNFLDASSGNPFPTMHATLLVNLGLIALGHSVIGAIVGTVIAYRYLSKHKT